MATVVAMAQPRQLYSYVAHPQLYSDHYPNHENTPEGLLSIALTRSSHRSLNTNNDAVRGVVLVQSKIKAQRISIKFIGRTTCRTSNERNPGSHHTATTDLFCHERTLSPRATPSADCPFARVEYPFEFRFPEAIELDPRLQNDASFKPDEAFEHEKGHPLPPSLWWHESTIRIEYFLEAEFVNEQRSFTLRPVVIHQLRFSPSVPEVGLPIQTALLSTPPIRYERPSRPMPEPGKERRASLKRLKSSLKGEKAEESSSTSLFVLRVPPQYRVSATSSLKVSLQATLSEGTTQPAPVYLRNIRAQAFANISYRIPISSAANEEIRKGSIEKFDLFNRRYGKPGVEITENTTLEDFTINTIVPPTFKTYGVAVRYDVRYDLLLECAGKESEHAVEMRNVSIEPMTREGGHLGPPETPPPPRGSVDSTIPLMYGHLRPRAVSVWRPVTPPPSYTQ